MNWKIASLICICFLLGWLASNYFNQFTVSHYSARDNTLVSSPLTDIPIKPTFTHTALPNIVNQGQQAELGNIQSVIEPFAQQLSFFQLINQADDADLITLLAGADHYPLPERHQLIALIYLRLVEFDPVAAFDHIQNKLPKTEFEDYDSGTQELRIGIARFFKRWAQIDLEEAVTYAKQMQDLWVQQLVANVILETNANLPLEQVRDIAVSLNNEYLYQEIARKRELQDFMTDPLTNWQQYLKLTQWESMRGLTGAAELWLSQDPNAAMQAIDGLGDYNIRSQVKRGALAAWVRQNKEQAIAWLADNPDLNNRDTVSAIFDALANLDEAQAFSLVTTLNPEAQQFAIAGLLNNMSNRDPFKAADWISNNYNEAINQTTIINVTLNFTRKDPSATLDWLLSLPVDASKRALATPLGSLPSNTNFEAVATKIANVSDEELNSNLKLYLVNRWASVAPQQALNWIKLQNPAQQSDLQIGLIDGWARHNTQGAVQFIAQLPSVDDRDSGYYRLIANYILRDNQDFAREIVARIENDELRTRAEAILSNMIPNF